MIYNGRQICDKSEVTTREMVKKGLTIVWEKLQPKVLSFARFLRSENEDKMFQRQLVSETKRAKATLEASRNVGNLANDDQTEGRNSPPASLEFKEAPTVKRIQETLDGYKHDYFKP